MANRSQSKTANLDISRLSALMGENLLVELFDSVPVAVYTCDENGLLTYYNPAAVNLWGYKPELRNPEKRFCGSVKVMSSDGEFVAHEDCWLAKAIKNNKTYKGRSALLQHASGKVRQVLSYASPLHDDTGRVTGGVNVIVDVTQVRQSEQRIQDFSRIFEDSLNEIFMFDADTLKFIEVNKAALRNMGYREDEIRKLTPVDIKPKISKQQFKEMVQPLRDGREKKLVFETVHQRKDGSLYDVEVHLQLLSSEQQTMFVAIILDISDRIETQRKLAFHATHDALTGLLNRREFEARVTTVLQDKKDGVSHALCFMDLDQFKVINDTCGHTTGDEMLRELSQQLQDEVRAQDTFARLGGDEFAVFIRDCSLDEAQEIVTRLKQVIEAYRLETHGLTFKVGVSMGLVYIDMADAELKDLLIHADTACYIAKEGGRNRIHLYREEDLETVQRKDEMDWVGRVHDALEKDQFELHAQPIVPVGAGKELHYEILIRMLSEDGSLVAPGMFLTAAERYNLIVKLDHWVIEHVIDALIENYHIFEHVSFFSINLSGQSLTNPEILAFIMEKVESSGIEGRRLCFEVTETAAISNINTATRFINALKEFGCRFALDDFGSGLSSFGYLKTLPVDYLKIDGTFVKDIETDPIDKAMVKSINEIGHVIGLETVAEHVENDEIRAMLHEMGVNYAQGYGIEKPRPFREILQTYKPQDE